MIKPKYKVANHLKYVLGIKIVEQLLCFNIIYMFKIENEYRYMKMH